MFRCIFYMLYEMSTPHLTVWPALDSYRELTSAGVQISPFSLTPVIRPLRDWLADKRCCHADSWTPHHRFHWVVKYFGTQRAYISHCTLRAPVSNYTNWYRFFLMFFILLGRSATFPQVLHISYFINQNTCWHVYNVLILYREYIPHILTLRIIFLRIIILLPDKLFEL